MEKQELTIGTIPDIATYLTLQVDERMQAKFIKHKDALLIFILEAAVPLQVVGMEVVMSEYGISPLFLYKIPHEWLTNMLPQCILKINQEDILSKVN